MKKLLLLLLLSCTKEAPAPPPTPTSAVICYLQSNKIFDLKTFGGKPLELKKLPHIKPLDHQHDDDDFWVTWVIHDSDNDRFFLVRGDTAECVVMIL